MGLEGSCCQPEEGLRWDRSNQNEELRTLRQKNVGEIGFLKIDIIYIFWKAFEVDWRMTKMMW